MTLAPLYSLKNLEFRYDQLDSEFKLGPLNMEIQQGKLTAILGRSGSGKTTLLSLLGLLRSQFEGQITININGETTVIGKDLYDEFDPNYFRATYMGFALQRGELLPYLSLVENAALLSRFTGSRNNKDIYQEIRKTFEVYYQREFVDNQLVSVMESKPAQVSQGQYQRAAIVRALANNPPIIMADEPTGNLDEHTGEEAMKIFQQIVEDSQKEKNPQSVIVVTHDLELAIKFADEIIVLKNGKKQSQYTQVETSSWVDEKQMAIVSSDIYNRIREDLK